MDRTIKDKIFNFRPLFFAAIFFCLGVLFSYLYILYGISLWWLLGLLLLAVPFFFCPNRKEMLKTGVAIALLLLSFCIGAFAFSHQMRKYADTAKYNLDTYVVGTVYEKQTYGDKTRLTLGDLAIEKARIEGKLNAYLPTSFCENIELSDEVLLQGKLKTDVEYCDNLGFRANDIGDDVRFELIGAEECQKVGEKFNLFALARSKLSKTVHTGMDEMPAAVTMAVLTGDTTGIEADLLENVRYGGIAHIFAVSGLHVGALYGFCLLLLKKTPLNRLPKLVHFILLAVILIFYGGICGFSASVIRAIVLCLVSYLAKLVVAKADLLDTLGLAAIIILLLNPSALFEVGFQLSFLACLGIALMRRPIADVLFAACDKIRSLFPKRKYTEAEEKILQSGDTLPKSIGEQIRNTVVGYLAVSLAAQLFTAPALLHHFGYLSGWAMLLNFLFVPIISAGFSFLLLFVLVACLLPSGCAEVVLYLPNVLWSALMLVFEAADFSTFAVTNVQMTGGSFVCYYGGCTFFTDKWNLRRRWKWIFAAVCFIGCAATLVVVNIL